MIWKLTKGCVLLTFLYAVLRTAEYFPPLFMVLFLGLGYFTGHLTTVD